MRARRIAMQDPTGGGEPLSVPDRHSDYNPRRAAPARRKEENPASGARRSRSQYAEESRNSAASAGYATNSAAD
jgi:hypothetical protein